MSAFIDTGMTDETFDFGDMRGVGRRRRAVGFADGAA